MRAQSISRRNPARPDVAALIQAGLINFGCIDAVQPIDRAIQSERITVSHSNFGRQTWPDHSQQQRCNENAHVSCFSRVISRVGNRRRFAFRRESGS
jgi:hypothetical protein